MMDKAEVIDMFDGCYRTYFNNGKVYSDCDKCPFWIECRSIDAGSRTLCEVMTARTKRNL